jgi:hypothetical protein
MQNIEKLKKTLMFLLRELNQRATSVHHHVFTLIEDDGSYDWAHLEVHKVEMYSGGYRKSDEDVTFKECISELEEAIKRNTQAVVQKRYQDKIDAEKFAILKILNYELKEII